MRTNEIQTALDEAQAGRRYLAEIESIAVRERIAPIERRRVIRLAGLTSATVAN